MLLSCFRVVGMEKHPPVASYLQNWNLGMLMNSSSVFSEEYVKIIHQLCTC